MSKWQTQQKEGVLYDPVRVEFESKQNHPKSREESSGKLGTSWQRRGTKGICLTIETLISGSE